MLIDTHAHLNFRAYRKDRPEVIARCLKEGMKVINVGSQQQNSLAAVELARQYPGNLFAAVGFHPIHVVDTDFVAPDFEKLLAENEKYIVAIGEVGLDYYRLPEDKRLKEETISKQRETFRFFIGLARQHSLPLILHCRDAYADLLEELKGAELKSGGVVHCFLGNRSLARKFLDLGLHLGFTGIITFADNNELLEVVKEVPLDRILIETDAPYLAPGPFRRQRNEPPYVRYVAEKIAELKGISYDEVVRQTAENAVRLFRLPR